MYFTRRFLKFVVLYRSMREVPFSRGMSHIYSENASLAPSLTPRGGILVRMVSCGMVGMAGVVS